MPHHVEWLIHQRVLYFNLEGIIDRDAFIKVNDLVAAQIEEGIEFVHLVADVRDQKFHTMSVTWIAHNTAIRHKKVGYVMVLGANTFLKFTTEAVRIITRAKIRSVDTIEAALAELWNLDKSLPRQL